MRATIKLGDAGWIRATIKLGGAGWMSDTINSLGTLGR
jgi:hypothetical protein